MEAQHNPHSKYKKDVSAPASKSSTTTDIIDLSTISDSLDEALKTPGVYSEGLCPKRHALYQDCFDSVILKLTNEEEHSHPIAITIEGSCLLSRIRDELNTTSDAYKKLYESSVQFGLNKAIEARKTNERLHARIDELLKEKRELLDRNEVMHRKMTMDQKKEEKKRDRERSRYALDLRRLKGRNEKIKRGLEQGLLSASADLHNAIGAAI